MGTSVKACLVADHCFHSSHIHLTYRRLLQELLISLSAPHTSTVSATWQPGMILHTCSSCMVCFLSPQLFRGLISNHFPSLHPCLCGPHGVPPNHQAHSQIRIVVLAIPSDKSLLPKHLGAFLPDCYEILLRSWLLNRPSLTTPYSSTFPCTDCHPLAYFIFFYSTGHIIYFTAI